MQKLYPVEMFGSAGNFKIILKSFNLNLNLFIIIRFKKIYWNDKIWIAFFATVDDWNIDKIFQMDEQQMLTRIYTKFKYN